MYKYTLTKNSIGVLDSIESKMHTANFLVLFTIDNVPIQYGRASDTMPRIIR